MQTLLSLLRNTLFNVVSNLLNRLGNTLLFIGIVQMLGIDAAGVFSIGVSFFFISSRFSFWGLDHLFTREVAKDKGQATQFFTNFLAARLILSAVMMVIFLFIVYLSPYQQSTKIVIYVMLLAVLPENINNLCWAAFASFEELQFSSISSLVGGVLKVGSGFFLLWQGYDLIFIAIVFLLSQLLTMAINLKFVYSRYIRQWQRPNWPFLRTQLSIAYPFVFIGIFFIMDNRLDNLIISFLSGEEAVGMYTAATAVMVALGMLSEGYRMAVLPILSRYRQERPGEIRALYEQSLKYIVIIGLPLSVATLIIADELIGLIYRQKLATAVPTLQILSFSLIFVFVNVLNNRLLIVYDRQSLIARILLLTVLQNIIINLLLVPAWGAIGAALARVASSFTLYLLLAWAVREFVPKLSFWQYTWRPLLGALLMGLVMWQIADWGIWWQMLVGGLVYAASLLLAGTLSTSEKEAVRLFVKQKVLSKKWAWFKNLMSLLDTL
jgi:O-antigen/teichoic acid export membrane protein